MPATVVDAVSHPYPCEHGCFEALTLDERAQGIEALYRFDDAMRGWGQQVIWDLAAPWLWRVQQQLETARWVAVRDDACIYARLVGFCLHELVHAMCGDPTLPNYGMPVGLPYGVPDDVPAGGEADYLHPFNQIEARAWVGGGPLARRLFGIEWEVLPARDVGTYGFAGGNGAWYTRARLDELAAGFEEAEARGRARRPRAFPSAREMARKQPALPGRNDLCLCGSGQKYKKCCGRAA